MTIKFLILSILSFSVFGIKSPFQEMKKNDSDLKILNVSGSLYEYENNQRLHLIVNQPIIDYKFGNITLRNLYNDTRHYLKTTCGNYSNLTYDFYCYLDLRFTPKGYYLIDSFFYDYNIYYDNLTLLYIQEKNYTKNYEITYVNTSAVEYSRNQIIDLEFNDITIKYYKVNSIYVVNRYYQNDSYYIQLNCSNSKNYFVYCTGDFSYVPYGYYEIKTLKYDYQYYNLTYRITFYVNKKSYDDNVELLNITGLAYTNAQNNLTLIFNKNIESRYLSEFIFTDTKTNYSYVPNFYCYYTNYSIVDCIFNFSYVPIGYYRTAFTYKNKTNYSYAYLYVQERKVYQEIELLNVYSNLIKYTRDQVVYLSFIGKYETDTLAYIVLDDFYSRKYVLQTLQCYDIYSNYTQFDLRCKVDLSNVPSGLYKVSEYYIYNKHYYSSMNINVNVFA